MNYYIGIDPGKNGGIAVIAQAKDGLKALTLRKMPLRPDGNVSPLALITLFGEFPHERTMVAIEDVHSMYGMSAASNFSFGFTCGMIEAIVDEHYQYTKVQPKEWQKKVWIANDVFKEIVKNKNGKEKEQVNTKLTSLNAARRLFPNVCLLATKRSVVPHDGIVDALLIAEWLRRISNV